MPDAVSHRAFASSSHLPFGVSLSSLSMPMLDLTSTAAKTSGSGASAAVLLAASEARPPARGPSIVVTFSEALPMLLLPFGIETGRALVVVSPPACESGALGPQVASENCAAVAAGTIGHWCRLRLDEGPTLSHRPMGLLSTRRSDVPPAFPYSPVVHPERRIRVQENDLKAVTAAIHRIRPGCGSTGRRRVGPTPRACWFCWFVRAVWQG